MIQYIGGVIMLIIALVCRWYVLKVKYHVVPALISLIIFICCAIVSGVYLLVSIGVLFNIVKLDLSDWNSIGLYIGLILVCLSLGGISIILAIQLIKKIKKHP